MAYQFGPLEAMMHVQQQGEMGRQRGEQSRLARLVSQGMSEPGGLARIAPEVAKIDPNAAFALQDRESQALETRRKLLTETAGIMAKMDPATRAQAWPTFHQRFMAADPELGAALPQQYDDAQFAPMIQQLAGLGQQGNISARAAGFEQLASGLTPEQRQQALAVELGLSPRAVAPGYAVKEVTNADGTTSFVQIATKGTAPGSAIPVGQSGAPQMNDLIAQANQMVRAGRPVEEVDAWLQASAQAQPNVRMGMGQSDADRAEAKAQESAGVAESEGLAKQGLERIEAIRQKAALASTQSASLDELERLLTQAYTGPGANTVLNLGRVGSLIGVADDQKVSAAEAAQAISNRLALSLRNPAGGEGMPGAMSDADRAFLQSSIPSLQNTPDGWKQMIAFQRKLNEAAIDQAREVERFLAAGGKPRDVYAHMQKYAERNPIFGQSAGQSAQGPRAGQVEDGYRFKGGDPADPNNWERV